MLEKRLNHDAIRTKVQIFKNHLARDILFLRRRVLYPAELLRLIFSFLGVMQRCYDKAIIPASTANCKCARE